MPAPSRFRPSQMLMFLLICLVLITLFLRGRTADRRAEFVRGSAVLAALVTELGITDLCISTEARYIRHPAVSDPLAAFMDHPGALEHFPSGSFWAPPPQLSLERYRRTGS